MADVQAKSTESKNTIKDLLEINKYDVKTVESTTTPSTEITQEVVDKINTKHKSSHTIESLQSMEQKKLDNLLNCL